MGGCLAFIGRKDRPTGLFRFGGVWRNEVNGVQVAPQMTLPKPNKELAGASNVV